MKKFLSIFVALAMVLSLFAGVGARTAKATTPVATCISHDETAKTITYYFSTPVLLLQQSGAGSGEYSAVTAAKLAVYVSVANAWSEPDDVAPGVTVTSATFDTAGTTLTITYTGSLVAGSSYAVDAYNYTVVSSDTFTPIASSSIVFTVPAAAAGSFTVTATAGTGGGVSPATQSVLSGGTATVTIAAATNYYISALTDNAADVTAGTPVGKTSFTYTISNVTATHAVAAAFTAIPTGPFTVTASVAAGLGTVTPLTQPVLSGGTATVTITATTGYRIAAGGLTDDTVASPITAADHLTSYVYTISNVYANDAVAVTFEAIPSFTVTATAGVNGTLLPATQSIVSGSPATVTITAATGYQIATLTDNTVAVTAGTPVGKTSFTYTIASVIAAHTVAATFGAYVAAVPSGTVALGTPTQVAGTTSALLGWTYSATDATSFNIYRNQTGIIPTPATVAPMATVASTVLAFTDATTVANQAYYYWVAAVNATGIGTLSTGRFISITAATAVVPVIPGTTAGTLTLTPAGNFVGGVDGSGAAGVDALGTVVSGSGTSYVVNVTTAGVGSFDTVNGITVLHDTGVTSIDTDWATTGMKSISFTGSITGIFNVGDTIKVAGSSTKGVGKVISINAAGTLAVVNVTTAAVGVIGPKVYTTSYADSTDLDWLTAGTAQPITFDAAVTLAAGDILDVAMLQAVPGTSATAFLIVSGTPVKGDIATVTWQDTLAASHTVSYTAVTGDTAASVALALSQLIHALDLTTGNVDATVAGNLITLTQDVVGVAGNGKTLTATTTASVTPTLTIHTVGGLNSPAYVELGKTIKLVAVDATGAVVSVTWTAVGSASPAGPSAAVNTSGLVTADLALTGVTVVTATSGSATGVFAVVVIPVQVITSLKINLVPAVPVSTTVQQFGAIASNAAYSALDYTTQAVWTDALPVASIAATTGLLTYSTDETGNVYASAGGITATANVKITTGVVTLVTVVGPVTKVIVLTIGSDIVTVDDKATTVDAAPEITNGRTFVPIRFIAETFGSTVTWLPETKGVTIVLGDTTIGLQIGNATAVINGTIIALDAAPYIKNSRTMVPLRVISESFGGNVAWDPINHIITITYVLPVVPAA